MGQCELMYTYDRLFGQYNHTVAQMLLTWEDFDHENRLQTTCKTRWSVFCSCTQSPSSTRTTPSPARSTLLGDNDTLAALVGTCIHADLVVLMSDIDGLYTADPHPTPTRSSSRWSKKSPPKLKCWRAAQVRPWVLAVC